MSALTALLVFLISFALVAVLFRMPVSFALGTSSLLVLAYAGFQLVTVPQFAFSGLDSFALLAIPLLHFCRCYHGIQWHLQNADRLGKVLCRPGPGCHWHYYDLCLHGLWRSYWLSYGHHQRHWKNDGA